MKQTRWFLAFGGGVAAVALAVTACGGDEGAMMEKKGDTMQKSGDTTEKLPDQLFAAHFVDSAPTHGQVFAQAPERVVINFNFTLSEISSISVAKDGTALNTGPAAVAPNKLSMAVPLGGSTGDGAYVVTYKACWPDRSCHDGRFGFKVDSKTRAQYTDMTGKAEVTVEMKDLKFGPANLVLSKGTKVTWKNSDGVTHFVNTDPHPSHNSLSGLNSLEVKPGESYTFTFSSPGEYAYHCSLHYPAMTGRALATA